ncbi:MAG: hypothetical protein JSV91_15445 [Phycisphaerales bacterium]|nr:MAG: hypothetical protein JSV91_15445 [Phycisphaerales bacterium]
MPRTVSDYAKVALAALPRVWWSVLLAIHVPAFITVWSSIILESADPTRLSSALALVLTMAFFILKIRDVGFLRLRKRQHSFVAFCILAAVFHHGVIAPDVDEGALLQATAVVVTGVAVRRLVRRAPRILRDCLDLLRAALTGPNPRPAVAAAGCFGPAPCRRLRAYTHSIPRAPPA